MNSQNDFPGLFGTSGSTDFPDLPPPPSAHSPNYIPTNNQQNAASKRLQQTHVKVDEVVGIMRVNVEKVLERDQKLTDLADRADALEQGASQFEQTGKLKRKHWRLKWW